MADPSFEIRHGGQTVQIVLPLDFSGWDVSLLGSPDGECQRIECAVRLYGHSQKEFQCPGLGNGFAPVLSSAEDLVTLVQAANAWIKDSWTRCQSCMSWMPKESGYSDGIETICLGCAEQMGF